MIQILDKYGNTSTDDGRVIILDANGNVKKITSGGGGSPTGPAGGDLSGTYPNPSVVWANGQPTYDLVYYPLTSNPAGYLTSSALTPYLTTAAAALIYYPIPTGTISQYIRGDGSLATFPTIPTYTVNNGLRSQTVPSVNPNNFQLGSSTPTGAPLLFNTWIYGNTYTLNVLSVSTSRSFSVQNQSLSGGVGADISSDFGTGLVASGVTAIQASVVPSSNNTVIDIIKVNRQVAGSGGANGVGGAILFNNSASNGQSYNANRIISKWTDATFGTITSQFEITSVNLGGTESTTFTLKGTGQLQLNQYTGTTFDNTPNKSLGVDASGNVITFTGGTGSGTVTSIATTGPITGGTITTSGTIGITQATTSTDGYLSATDWNIFNNKQNASSRRNANNSTNNNINYCGYAPLGSAESATVWTITRITIAASGSITTGLATGVAWTNRESVIYI
jgi:hypothetical protein